MEKNEIIPLKITDVSIDGKGIGKYKGVAVFVPCSAIEDELEVKILKVKKNYAFGKIEKIIKASSGRIKPDCKVYPKCGGCAFRHISYEEELKIKEKYIKLVSKLDALSPLKTLTRGYSIVETENKIIKSVKELKTGDKIQIRLKDGKKEAQVI